ncbi:MAG: DUF4007 family protein [Saprospiraceae bacterium]|nr:DUF4007 family protein [Saprospiraceae bacterium]
MVTANIKYTFSGHETFACRNLWLKKGYDYVISGKKFKDEDAVVRLGVGKNMVGAIRFWLKAFNILTSDDEITDFGQRLLADDGWDPYLEDQGTLWLLHYQLVKTNYATIYNIIFGSFRREKTLFNKDSYISYLHKWNENGELGTLNENTLTSDFSVFARMYSGFSENDSANLEELNSKFFSELNLLNTIKVPSEMDVKKFEDRFQLLEKEQAALPEHILLYSILDKFNESVSISVREIETEANSPHLIFCMTNKGLIQKIIEITDLYKDIVYNDQAGIKELQFKKLLNPFNVLNDYYAK